MTAKKYLGLRVTPERHVHLSAIGAYSDAAYNTTTFVNVKHENVDPDIATICNRLALKADSRGGQNSAVDFALKSTFLWITGGEQIDAKEDETVIEFALRATAERIGG